MYNFQPTNDFVIVFFNQCQFALIFLHVANASTYTYTPNKLFKAFFFIHLLYMVSMWWLFQTFYKNAYNEKKKMENGEKPKRQ